MSRYANRVPDGYVVGSVISHEISPADERKSRVIKPGDDFPFMYDYYCHKHLGGCGAVFLAPEPKVEYDETGVMYSSTIECPHCRRIISAQTGSLTKNNVVYASTLMYTTSNTRAQQKA